jgi:EF hand domain-containing protein
MSAMQPAKPGRHWPGFFMCAWLCAGTALAQVTAAADYLARMDADHDHHVSLVEYQDWLSYAFDAMDRDHDGVLSPGELPGGRGAAITREQHRARLAQAFGRQDRNGDGFLDARELAAPPP